MAKTLKLPFDQDAQLAAHPTLQSMELPLPAPIVELGRSVGVDIHAEIDQVKTLTPQVVAALEAMVVAACEPMVQAAAAVPPSKFVVYASRGIGFASAIFAVQQAARDGADVSKIAVAPLLVIENFPYNKFYTAMMYPRMVALPTEEYTARFQSEDRIPDDGSARRAPENVGAWLTRLPAAEVPDLVIAPLAARGGGGGHAMATFIYPKLRAIALFDSNDSSFVHAMSCILLPTLKRMYGLDGFEGVVFTDSMSNADGGPINDKLQVEMEHEVKDELGTALLNNDGFCVAWSRLAMYLCVRLGLYHPNLTMGMLQKAMRKDPAFMATVIIGSITRAVADAVRLAPDYMQRILASYEQKVSTDDSKEWALTDTAKRKLNIDVLKTKDGFKHLLDFLK